jgi:L-2,4-diaminobutyrate decarboxylase
VSDKRLAAVAPSGMSPSGGAPNLPDHSQRESAGEDWRNAFSATSFDQFAAVAVDKIGELLRRQAVEGVTLEDPAALMAEARALMTTNEPGASLESGLDTERFARIVDLYFRTGIKVGSTGYMARQFSRVIPAAAVFDMVTAIAPQPATFYEAGQLANVADKIICQEFARRISWNHETCDMITTSGASLANLTAIVAARNDRLSGSWAAGAASTARGIPTIAVGEDAHYSVSRVPGIIGIGQDNILKLPLNGRRQICALSAAAAIEAARAKGRDVFCIVASAGSTSVGAIDPLEELAEIAQAAGIWLHVDAAHSGAFLLSDKVRPRLRGIERADSFCVDAHKMLFVPSLCTLLFYRDGAKARGAFSQQASDFASNPASYVFDDREDAMSRFESGGKNFECTKRPAILNLWLVWALFGVDVIAQKIEYLVDLTWEAYRYLSLLPDFAVIHEPDSNILCFEHRPHGLPDGRVSALQRALWDRLRTEGKFFVSKVDIDGRTVLRAVFMNHEIDMGHVKALVAEIRHAAGEIG